MAGGLEIVGNLRVSIDDAAIDVVADGSRVRAEIADVAAGRPSLRMLRSSVELAWRLSRSLDARALTLEVTRHGKTVAELGSGVRGGTLARFLGMPRVRIVRTRS